MRQAGILMPLSSLPSRHGIGDMGEFSYQFIDLIRYSGVSIWQILPLNPLGYGNSPYQPYSSFAGDEVYLSLEELYTEGLLTEKPQQFARSEKTIHYEAVRAHKTPYLRQAFRAFSPDQGYEEFISQEWVYLYGVFRALKTANHEVCFNEWKTEHKNWIKDRSCDLTPYDEEIRYQMFLQYMFYKQWMSLKAYANQHGIKIMGDIPFYVGIDSLDVWSNQENFLIDSEGRPVFIAGVPPDYFSETGQRWGNPIYNWEYMKHDYYQFWVNRFAYNSKLFDIIRVDHFRAFDTYWKIPSACETAVEGEWLEAPGYELLDQVRIAIPDLQIVAEDLGDLRPEVYDLRDHYQFPGMKILQFTFQPWVKDMEEFKDSENMIVYTGTHDNQTIRGWYSSLNRRQRKLVRDELDTLGIEGTNIADRFVRMALESMADVAILPLQDIININDQGRLNTPGTLGSPNWEWKLRDFKAFCKQLDHLGVMIQETKRAANQAQQGATDMETMMIS